MARLFVAAWPTAAVIERLAGIPRPRESGVRWVPQQNWHITLRFIGDADADEIAAKLCDLELPRATARLGPVAEPLGSRQIVVPVDGVDALAAVVRSATGELGSTDHHHFLGHLTIVRLKHSAHSTVIGTPIKAEFEIDEISLVTSDLKPEGADYTTVARFATS